MIKYEKLGVTLLSSEMSVFFLMTDKNYIFYQMFAKI